MNTEIYWLIGTALFLIIEAVTYQFVCLWFAVGCIAGLITSLADGNITVQISIMIIVSAIALVLSRPLVKKLRKEPVATNADRICGSVAEVVLDIDNTKGTGQVRADGNLWSAKTATGDTINKGEQVRVLEIQGAKLVVEKM